MRPPSSVVEKFFYNSILDFIEASLLFYEASAARAGDRLTCEPLHALGLQDASRIVVKCTRNVGHVPEKFADDLYLMITSIDTKSLIATSNSDAFKYLRH